MSDSNKKKVKKALLSEASIWFNCDVTEAEWLFSKVEKYCSKPVHKLEVALTCGAARFLLSLLRIVNPQLPFDMLVEADIEHLILELDQIHLKQGEHHDKSEDLVTGYKMTQDFWGSASGRPSTIILYFKDEGGIKKTGNLLSALRLAAFCCKVKMVVIDSLNLREYFDSWIGIDPSQPSDIKNYLFQNEYLDGYWHHDAHSSKNISPRKRIHMIKKAAYYRALRRGFVGGNPKDDWLAAESEIDSKFHCFPKKNQ